MKRIILLLVIFLEAVCVFLICWFPSHKKAASEFNHASVTLARPAMITLGQDITLQSQSGGEPLTITKGSMVRARRLTESSIKFFGDETRDYQGTLPLEAFSDTDKINELLAPARNAEEIRKEEYLQNSLIKNIILTLDYFVIMGGLCVLAARKYDWMGFALNILLVVVLVIIVFACRAPIAELLF